MNTVGKGLTIYITIGHWAGFRFLRDGPSLRLTLGFIGLCILFMDIEMVIVALNNKMESLEKELEGLRYNHFR